MTRYKHYVRKSTDAPEIRSATWTSCASGVYNIQLVGHGFIAGDEIILSSAFVTPQLNGRHTVSSVYNADNFYITVAACYGTSPLESLFIQQIDISTYTEVFPLGFFPEKFTYDQPEGQVFFVKLFAGELKFTNRPSESITDYTFFSQSELDSNGLIANSCVGFEYLIQRECNGEYSDYYSAVFSTYDGEWDRENCTFTVQPKPDELYDCILTQTLVNVLGATPTVTTLYEYGSNPDLNFTNTRKFSSVLTTLIENTCPLIYGVISDFFQINPANTSTYNYVSEESNPYTLMTIGAEKDIKSPIPSYLQTNVSITFLDFMNELAALFNVYFTIENKFIRIEHISYFEALTGLDLTQARYDDYNTGKNKYKFLPTPHTETFEGSGRSLLQVTYDNTCNLSNNRDAKITASLISTQVNLNEGAGGSGLFLFANTYDSGTGKYPVIGSLNDTLFYSSLFLKFHRHNRAQSAGSLKTFDGADIYDEFLIYSSKKNKLQAEINIPLCCEDEFNPEDKITTDLGQGLVYSAEFGIKSDTLKLELKYGDANVVDIVPSDIQGLDLWLDGSVGVTASSGIVSNWADQSGNGRDASQATLAKRPVRSNGNTAIAFDGVDDGLVTPAFQTFPAKRGSIFIVFACGNPLTVLLNDHIIGTYGNGAGQMWDISTNGDGADYKFISSIERGSPVWYNVQIAPTSYVGATYGYSSFFLYSAIRSSDTEIIGRGNGTIGANTTPGTLTVPNTVPASNPLNIGNSFIAGNSDPFFGDIAEIVIYDHALGDYERQQIEQYFFKRYHLKQYT